MFVGCDPANYWLRNCCYYNSSRETLSQLLKSWINSCPIYFFITLKNKSKKSDEMWIQGEERPHSPYSLTRSLSETPIYWKQKWCLYAWGQAAFSLWFCCRQPGVTFNKRISTQVGQPISLGFGGRWRRMTMAGREKHDVDCECSQISSHFQIWIEQKKSAFALDWKCCWRSPFLWAFYSFSSICHDTHTTAITELGLKGVIF